nr:hypothetical protein [Victivallales bacterium]
MSLSMNPVLVSVFAAIAVAVIVFVSVKTYLSFTRIHVPDFESRSGDFIVIAKDLLSPISAIIVRNQSSPSLSRELSDYRRISVSAGGFYGLNVYEIYALKFVLPSLFSIFAAAI